MIASLKISAVLHASDLDGTIGGYEIPKQLGIFRDVGSKVLKAGDILTRIEENRQEYQKKFDNKIKKEQEFWKKKQEISPLLTGEPPTRS